MPKTAHPFMKNKARGEAAIKPARLSPTPAIPAPRPTSTTTITPLVFVVNVARPLLTRTYKCRTFVDVVPGLMARTRPGAAPASGQFCESSRA